MPRCFSTSIQSDVACRALLRDLTVPASWIAPPNSSSFSVSVVLPASGCEMIANVRRRATSRTRSAGCGLVVIAMSKCRRGAAAHPDENKTAGRERQAASSSELYQRRFSRTAARRSAGRAGTAQTRPKRRRRRRWRSRPSRGCRADRSCRRSRRGARRTTNVTSAQTRKAPNSTTSCSAAVREQVSERPQRDARRHRMAERRLDLRSRHVRRGDQHERDDCQQRRGVPRPRRPVSRRRRGCARLAVAPDDQHEAHERDERVQPLPRLFAKARDLVARATAVPRGRRNAERETREDRRSATSWRRPATFAKPTS